MAEALDVAHAVRVIEGWQQVQDGGGVARQPRLAGNAELVRVAAFDDAHRLHGLLPHRRGLLTQMWGQQRQAPGQCGVAHRALGRDGGRVGAGGLIGRGHGKTVAEAEVMMAQNVV